MKNSMKEQRAKRQRKTKKIIFKSKQEFARGHSFTTSAKKSKFRIIAHFCLLSTNIEILSKQTPLFDVLDWNSKPWVISEFYWKTIAIRSTLSRIVFCG